MSAADIAAIQEHVRKHSAPVAQPPKAKRTAEDAKVGDEVWIEDCISHTVLQGVVRIIEASPDGPRLVIVVGDSYYKRYHNTFGTHWGYWEDRPQAQSEQPAPLAEEDKPLPPQLGNVKMLIEKKGIDWVKDNLPDAWEAWKTAGLRKVESAYQELKKPGPLAGKTLRLQ